MISPKPYLVRFRLGSATEVTMSFIVLIRILFGVK